MPALLIIPFRYRVLLLFTMTVLPSVLLIGARLPNNYSFTHSTSIAPFTGSATVCGTSTTATRLPAFDRWRHSGVPRAQVGASADEQNRFVDQVLPAAQAAAQQLGVDPKGLIAQAALESNWGRSVPHDADGRISHNLFGMKATGAWEGASVTAPTTEVENGAPVSTRTAFRSYDNSAQSFQDYVSLLRGNPRYAAALNTGPNVQAFAAALQHRIR